MRLGGLILFALFLPLTLLGLLLIPLAILFAPRDEFPQIKEMVRALDQLNNAVWFGGIGRESVSSHAGRLFNQHAGMPRWARFVVWLTDRLQPGHCVEANKREQPVVDFINTQP